MADAKDCSLDELLREISNLSLNSDCSKETKKDQGECSILDALWSEDDTSDVETSLNLTEICSLNFSVDETDGFQLPVLLSSNNVTLRRKTKKKQGVSEDNTNGKSQSENTLQNFGSPFLDDLNYTLHNSNQESMLLDSIPVTDEESPYVCRELKSDFEQAENCLVNCQLSNNSLENNLLKVHLEQKLKNTKLDSTGKEMKWLDWDTTPPCSLSINANLSSNDVTSSKSSEKFPTNKGVVCNSRENESDILTNSFRSLKNDQLHMMIDSMCGQIENSDNESCVFGEDINSYNEPIESNTRSNIVSVSDETNNVVDQNFVQCTRKFDTPPMYGKQNSSNTEKDPCMNWIRNDSIGYDVEYLSNELGKVKTDPTETSPLICKLNKNSEDGNHEPLSNKENACIPGSKKKVIILSSDSDSDSVWEDVVDSDDSDCKKYDISLSSRLGKCLSLNDTTKHTRDTETDDFIKEPNNERKRNTLPSGKVRFSDSDDDDDDFEQFLDKMKTPKPKFTPRLSLKSFVVEDNWIDSSEDDDDVSSETFTFTTPKSSTLPKRTLPIKKLNTPRIQATPVKVSAKDNISSEISTVRSIKKIVTPYLNTPHKFWRKSRDLLIEELFMCYNKTVFDNKLPVDLPITWNKQMTKTAGFCYYITSSMNKKCRIELSDKVVDSCDRIRDTLIHELCHAATWLIDGVRAGHGPHWKRWAHKARMMHSDLPPISRCHSYDINYKFTYRCVKCQHSFGRHSKSVNLKTARCAYCLSHLELLPRLNKDGTPAKARAPTKFSLFVKDNYGKIKAKDPGSSHQEIMKELSKQFALKV